MSDNSKISQLPSALAPLLAEDDFVVRRGSANARVSMSELAKDVHTVNNDEFIYLKGDEGTDGSLRIKPDISEILFEFQLRSAGVWNDTGIQIAASTVHIGRDLSLSGAGEWIQTQSVNTGQKSLIPHISFDDNGTGMPHLPVLGQKVIRFVLQSDSSVEFTGTDLQIVATNPSELLATKIYLTTGSTVATQDVRVIFRRGVDTSGPIFWSRNFPASLMGVADTEFEIDLLGEVGGSPGEPIHIQLLSDASMSVRGNSAGAWWLALDFHPLVQQDMLTDTMVLCNDAGLVFQNDGGFVVNDQFPGSFDA